MNWRAAAERRRVQRDSAGARFNQDVFSHSILFNRFPLKSFLSLQGRLPYKSAFPVLPPQQLLFEQTRRSRVAPDVVLNGKPPGARAPSNSRTHRSGPPAAPDSAPPCGQIAFVRNRFKIDKGYIAAGYTDAGTTRPRSASEQRPVRQRQKRVGSHFLHFAPSFTRKGVVDYQRRVFAPCPEPDISQGGEVESLNLLNC